jgi:hypothetical protein
MEHVGSLLALRNDEPCLGSLGRSEDSDFFVIAKGCRASPRGTTRKRAFFSKKDLALSLILPMISPPYGKDFMA